MRGGADRQALSPVPPSFQTIARRRGKKIATTATVARKLLTRAWHLLTHAERAAASQALTAAAPRAGTR